LKVKLADGKERTIQHMMMTTFWHPDGTPMSAQQFMELLFGKLPTFFKNEAELRAIWSVPDTRKKSRRAWFWRDQMLEMQRIIDEKSDLSTFLLMSHTLQPTREARAREGSHCSRLQRQAARFSRLSYCITSAWCRRAVRQADSIAASKYHDSLADAVADLGAPKKSEKCCWIEVSLSTTTLG
jgi:type I restriction enzyme R subunit